jgi:hypothetical protein
MARDDAGTPEADEESGATLVGAGSEIAGSVAGAGVGLIFGPPGAMTGAVVGPLVTRALKKVLGDLAGRRLSRRETARAGATAAYAAIEVAKLVQAGRTPRDDGFFDDSPDERSAAEEIADAVLMAAQRDAEEKKTQLLGTMLAHLAFDVRVDRTLAHLLVRLAETLTYRQLCLLALYNLDTRDRFDILDGVPLRQGAPPLDPALGLLEEIRQLHGLSMLQQRSLEHAGTDIILGLTTINPGRQELVGLGGWLYELMALRENIPEETMRGLADQLNRTFR